MTANDLTTPPLPLLVQGRPQVSFARDPSEGGRGWGGGGGGGGQITSKGVGLLRSNLPLGDSLLRGAGYFVTGLCNVLNINEIFNVQYNDNTTLLQYLDSVCRYSLYIFV